MPSLLDSNTNADKGVSKDKAERKIVDMALELGLWQTKLYAQKKFAILVVLQGLDGAGKDNTVKNVFDAVNPAGCNVKNFKAPTAEEQAHDFLWRIHAHTPEKGMIQIFNRSHYEDVLVPVVKGTISGKALTARYEAINNFERMLAREGTLIFKFMLNVSAEEQRKRLDERVTDPDKRWKYDPVDQTVFAQRDAYLRQYDQVLAHCRKAVPWHVIPADQKWFKNYQILKIINKELAKVGIEYPKIEID